jgi:hypothetical protein
LQGWEQGRKQPSGAARALLAIARTNPKAVLAVSALSSASECLLPSTRFARSPGLSRLAVGKTPGNPDNQAW